MCTTTGNLKQHPKPTRFGSAARELSSSTLIIRIAPPRQVWMLMDGPLSSPWHLTRLQTRTVPEKFKKNKKRLKEICSGKYEAKDIGELQKLDRLFLLFSIIEGFKGNSYPHQTNLQEYSARAIDEWQREEEKGHGMDWER